VVAEWGTGAQDIRDVGEQSAPEGSGRAQVP
jgi:hypothetical protein